MISLQIRLKTQELIVYDQDFPCERFLVSTAKNGGGEIYGSQCTPRGRHVIRAKIGAGCPVNTIFLNRRPVGGIFSPERRNYLPNQAWILTRILWLSGLEVGKNRLGKVDTMRRSIYIHGSPDDTIMGIPGSNGCICMHNKDVIRLFDWVQVGTRLLICD